MGTTAIAEQMAEVLFPGVTNRMWRARLLTFSGVAALIGNRVVSEQGVRADGPLSARLAFERLYVSGLIRRETTLTPDAHDETTRGIPGSRLARAAFHSGDRPLGPGNFLKGQATNGPLGVMARLARSLGIVDEDGDLAPNGLELLKAWGKGQVPVLHLDSEWKSQGGGWMGRTVTKLREMNSGKEPWPDKSWQGWREIVAALHPDRLGLQEKRCLRGMLNTGSDIRSRCLGLLQLGPVKEIARGQNLSGDRGRVDRVVFQEGFLPRLTPDHDEVDRTIAYVIRMIDIVEQTAIEIEAGFRTILWALVQSHGRASLDDLLRNSAFTQRMNQRMARLGKIRPALEKLLMEYSSQSSGF